jgi:hypothetical protein
MPTTMETMPDQGMRHDTKPTSRHVMREGVTIGLLGAAAVMLAFFIADVVAGVPLRTPGMLGSALFRGAHGAGEAVITASTVLGYTAVHLLGFIAFGLAVSGLFALAERERRVLSLVFLLACCLTVAGALMAYFVAEWMDDGVTPWLFLVAHLLAGVTVVAALFHFHRRLLRQFPAAIE